MQDMGCRDSLDLIEKLGVNKSCWLYGIHPRALKGEIAEMLAKM